MMSLGVPAGAIIANQLAASKPATPPSEMVGISGANDRRLGPTTPRAFNWPFLTIGRDEVTLSKNSETLPASRSFMALLLPLYGMCTKSTPAASLNNSSSMWDSVPLPCEAALSLPGLDFARAINSLTVLAGTEGCATSMWGTWPTSDIGAKLLAGSKESFL